MLMPDQTLHQAVLDLREEVAGEFVDRDDAIDLIILGMLSGQNVFFLSKPGTAKSLLWKRITERIAGMRRFGIQFSRHTLPDDVTGPQSIPALMQGQYTRLVDGFLPTAHGGLLDELPRAAEATANILLELINEGTYNQNGQKVQSDLHFVVAAANSTLQAEHDGLGATWDRFMWRAELDQLEDQDSLRALWDVDFPPIGSFPITWDQVMAAHLDAQKVKIPDDVFHIAYDLQRKAATEHGAPLSNRRWRQSKLSIQVFAWLDGADEAGPQHLDCFSRILWDTPEQIAGIEKLVAEVSAPNYKEALDLADTVTSLAEDVEQLVKGPTADLESGALAVMSRLGSAGIDATDMAGTTTGKSLKVVNDALTRLAKVYDANIHKLSSLPANVRPMPFDQFIQLHRR